jgi:hypothetical protein
MLLNSHGARTLISVFSAPCWTPITLEAKEDHRSDLNIKNGAPENAIRISHQRQGMASRQADVSYRGSECWGLVHHNGTIIVDSRKGMSAMIIREGVPDRNSGALLDFVAVCGVFHKLMLSSVCFSRHLWKFAACKLVTTLTFQFLTHCLLFLFCRATFGRAMIDIHKGIIRYWNLIVSLHSNGRKTHARAESSFQKVDTVRLLWHKPRRGYLILPELYYFIILLAMIHNLRRSGSFSTSHYGHIDSPASSQHH